MTDWESGLFVQRSAPPVLRESSERQHAGTDRARPEVVEWIVAVLLGCVAVGLFLCGPTEVAHGPVNGMGSKGGDDNCLPLGTKHHREQHRLGLAAFEAKCGFKWEREAAVYRKLYFIVEENGQ